jgi:CHAT domain-containing protein
MRSPCPGTAEEISDLKALFEPQRWKIQVLLGTEASEPKLQAIESPTVLHLATHGFFFDELPVSGKNSPSSVIASNTSSATTAKVRDPMLRSGLALSGAQTTLNLWSKGKVPPLAQDGILTAAEAASLNLNGTFLVTLSACETGMGEARSGEGVMGLKRGFAVAGAENLLMTLWQISDDETVALMNVFYERVLKGEHPARALPAIQTEFLVRLRKEHGLYHAINLAGPFVLVGGTSLP